MDVENWIDPAKHRNKWGNVVKSAETHAGLYRQGVMYERKLLRKLKYLQASPYIDETDRLCYGQSQIKSQESLKIL